MAEVVQGKDAILSMEVDSVYHNVLCGTDVTYEVDPEMIERTGPTSGGARQFMRRLEVHHTTVTGLTKIENDGTTLSWFYLNQAGTRRAVQDFKLRFADSDGNDVIITGSAAIGKMNINGPAADFSTGVIEIWWDTPDIDVIPSPTIPVVQDPIYFTLSAGDDDYTNVLLTDPDTEILEVCLEGTQHDVVLTGTPGNRQCKFTIGTGTILFQYAEVVDRKGFILYQH